MKRTIVCILALIFVSGIFMGAGAQEKKQKIAIIDLGRIMAESADGKAMRDELEKTEMDKMKEAGGMEKELLMLQDKLSNDALGYSEEKKTELKKDFQKKMETYQQFKKSAQEELYEMQSAMMKKLEDAVYPIIDTIAKAQALDFIFSKMQSGIIYANPDSDITQEVLDKLASEKKKGTN